MHSFDAEQAKLQLEMTVIALNARPAYYLKVEDDDVIS